MRTRSGANPLELGGCPLVLDAHRPNNGPEPAGAPASRRCDARCCARRAASVGAPSHHLPMDGMAIEWVGAVALGILTGWQGYRFGGRQERDQERRARDLTAATELVAPLRELQRLLRSFGREGVSKDEVASVFLRWSTAFDQHGHRLPRQWQHVDRSVRAAAGTVFGGISLIHIRPESNRMDLGEPDAMWQDYADDYLGYITRCILIWGDTSPDAPKVVANYDVWLVQTDRREPFGQNNSG